MRLDHVVFPVEDLTAAADELAGYGLTSVDGGTHPHWGTANRVVPLGSCYLELVAVVDPTVAEGNVFGRWVLARRSSTLAPGSWAVRTDEIDAVCRRLGLTAAEGERRTAEGSRLSWRITGVEQATANPALPFFLEWGEGTPLPGRVPVSHPNGARGIETLTVRGDADRLDAWLATDLPELRVTPSGRRPAAVTRVTVRTARGGSVQVPAGPSGLDR